VSAWKYDPPGPPVPRPGCRKTALAGLAGLAALLILTAIVFASLWLDSHSPH